MRSSVTVPRPSLSHARELVGAHCLEATPIRVHRAVRQAYDWLLDAHRHYDERATRGEPGSTQFDELFEPGPPEADAASLVAAYRQARARAIAARRDGCEHEALNFERQAHLLHASVELLRW